VEPKPILKPFPPPAVSFEPSPKKQVLQKEPRPEINAPPIPPSPEPVAVPKKLKRLRPQTFIPTAWIVKNYE